MLLVSFSQRNLNKDIVFIQITVKVGTCVIACRGVGSKLSNGVLWLEFVRARCTLSEGSKESKRGEQSGVWRGNWMGTPANYERFVAMRQ